MDLISLTRHGCSQHNGFRATTPFPPLSSFVQPIRLDRASEAKPRSEPFVGRARPPQAGASLANIFFGVLGTGREYISQKYSETLQIELDSELARIKETEEIEKKLQETKLQMKFKEYLELNPEFIESVKNRHKTFVNSPSVLEKVAFEEFKALT